jgi:hypothetical protein
MRYDLLYYEMTPTPGAQTERRGGAGPVRACLAVRTSPAAFVTPPNDIRLSNRPRRAARYRTARDSGATAAVVVFLPYAW